jgi:hypothetical protein
MSTNEVSSVSARGPTESTAKPQVQKAKAEEANESQAAKSGEGPAKETKETEKETGKGEKVDATA